MTNLLKRQMRSLFSTINIVLLLLQSFMPGFFVLFPTRAYAADNTASESAVVEEAPVSEESEQEITIAEETEVQLESISEEEGSSNEEQSAETNGEAADESQTESEPLAGPVPVVPVLEEVQIEAPQAETVVAEETDQSEWVVSGATATVAMVELGKTYTAPQNDGVQVTFTVLPDEPGSLTITEITLSDEQVAQLGAYSNIAYDITSDMEDGTFEYDLVLPMPEGADESAQLVYAESVEELETAQTVTAEKVDGTVRSEKLNHFTVFVVTQNPAAACPSGVYLANECYATIQAAINAADPSDADGIDTVSIDAGTYTENLSITKAIILEGSNAGINPNTQARSAESVILGQVYVSANDVTIDGITVSNPSYSGATIKGIHLYKNGSYISNILIKNSVLEDINNANTKGSYGIMIQGAVDTAKVINNKINNLSSAGWAHAIEVTPSGGGTEVPTNVVITGNTISNISNASHTDEYAFSVDWSSSNVLFADASEITFSNNNILGGDVRNLDSVHVLNARNNNWGTAVFQQIEDKVNHNCAQWKTTSGLSGLSCDPAYDLPIIGVVDYLSPIGAQKSIHFTNSGTPVAGGSSSTINLEVEAVYSPYEVERVRFRFAPQGQTCKQQYTAPYHNDLGDGIKNGDRYSVDWDVAGLPSGTYTACALMHRNTGAGSEGYKDANHAELSVIVDNTRPIVAVTQPAQDAFVGSPITIGGTAVDSSSGIKNVALHLYEVNGDGSKTLIPGCTSLPGTVSGTDWFLTINSGGSCTIDDGKYEIAAWAYDNVGNPGWAPRSQFFVDETRPTGSINTPSNGEFFNSNFTVSGVVSDALSGIKNVEVRIRNYPENSFRTPWQTATVDSSGNYSVEVDISGIPDDVYEVAVVAYDNAGNEKWLWPRPVVTVDTNAPEVELTAPVAGAVDGLVEVRGSVVDENPHDYYAVVKNSSGTVVAGPETVNRDTSFTDEFLFSFNTTGLPSGEYTVWLAARDAADNRDSGSEDSVVVTVDNTKPNIAVLAPSNDSAHSGTFTVSGTASDDGSGIQDIRVRFRNESNNAHVKTFWATYSDVTDTWSIDINDGANTLADGYYKIVVRARDNNGNSRSKTVRRVYVDNVQPSSEITTFGLEDGGEVSTASFSGLIEGTATDLPIDIASGVTDVMLEIMHTPFGASESSYWSGAGWQSIVGTVTASGTDTWSYQIPEESVLEGTYVISSHAKDAAGNIEATYTITVVYDKTIPEVSLSIDPATPDGRNSWYVTEPEITLTATDNYGTDYIEYQWNSSAGTWTTYTGPIKPPAEGQNILYYRAVDSVGNTSDIGVKEVKYDATAPTDGAGNLKVKNIGSTTADASWDKPANSTEIVRFVLEWKHSDGSTRSTSTPGDVYETELFDLYNGDWEVVLYSEDAAGNRYKVSETFTVGGSSDSSDSNVLGVTDDTTLTGTGTGGAYTSQGGSTESNSETDSQEENQDGGTPADAGAVLGDADSTCATWKFYLPLFLAIIQVMLAVSLEIANRDPGMKKLLLGLGVSALMIASFYFLRDPDCYTASGVMPLLARWFLPFSVLLAVVLRALGSMTIEEK